jgi:5-methylcytosine-specific restriction enzyme subunit McrC
MAIPVQNIYYLLCYAWNVLPENGFSQIEAEDGVPLQDFLVTRLLHGARLVLKRGLQNAYIYETAEVAGIKGKLDLASTLKGNLLHKHRTVCSYDELSQDILANQLLYSTLSNLVRAENINPVIKGEIKSLLSWFGNISRIEITDQLFGLVQIPRRNRLYVLLMHICKLINQQLLPTEKIGCYRFIDFSRDEIKMRLLFEAFIRNFYSIEQTQYCVVRRNYVWQFTGTDEHALKYIPEMKTDIVLENSDYRIIIDAKFYKETMVTNYSKEKIRSVNLYQLFSYLINQERNGDLRSLSATGILLYPTINSDYDLGYQFRDHAIKIKTVNLNTDWQHIRNRLLSIV